MVPIMPECSITELNPAAVEDLFPAGSTTENRFYDPTECEPGESNLPSTVYTPLLLSGTIRQVLTQYFCDESNIENPYLRKYITQFGKWTPDYETTGLIIENAENWKPENSGSKPAILIKDGEWVFDKQGIDNFIGDDYRSGEQFFTGIWRGSHSIYVLADNASETKIIAAEIAVFLSRFARPIRRELGLQDFSVSKIGAIQQVKEQKESYMTPIFLEYSVLDTWTLTEEAPRLKRIVFTRNAEEIFK